MLTLSRVAKIVGVMMCLGIVTPVLAESAPVYDADTMQQDDGMVDQAQDMPPPPAPEGGAAYVPSQQPTLSVEQGPSMSAPAAGVVVGSSGTVEQRLRRMEQQLNNTQTGEGASKVESLQEQVQTLRGQVEQLTHQLEQLQNQQKSMYSDLDTRLSQQAANASKPVAVSSAPPESYSSPAGGKLLSKPSVAKQTAKPDAVAEKATTQPNVAEEQQIYQTAYNLIKAKKYNDAVTALQGMLKKYPSGQFASNAHYWLGELYGLMGKNDQALSEFSTVVKVYPDSPRISDAQLKVGLLLASQMKWADAKSALKKVVNHYPGTASARLASEQLKQIKDAGH